MKKIVAVLFAWIMLLDFAESKALSHTKDSKTHKYFPQNKTELLTLLKDEKIKLDSIDTNAIDDMSYLFCASIWTRCNDSAKERKDFRGIESWDTSNVKNMSAMFYAKRDFNAPIGKWNVAKVESMSAMFREAESFNQDISAWDTGNVISMRGMFTLAKSFNQPLNGWNVAKVKNMNAMFALTNFNQPLDKWDMRSVEDIDAMFAFAKSFNQDINAWKLGSVKRISWLFKGAKSLNQNLDSMQVPTNIEDKGAFENSGLRKPPIWYQGVFRDSKYYEKILSNIARQNNQYIPKNKEELLVLLKNEIIRLDSINTSQIMDMSYLFCVYDGLEKCVDSAFERKDFKGIESWDTSNVVDMNTMFYRNARFNEPLNGWNVAKVKNMNAMFALTNFNQPLDKWDTRNVVNMRGIFYGAWAFNGNISTWRVEKVKNLNSAFAWSNFNGNLNAWNPPKNCDTRGIFYHSPMKLIPKWLQDSRDIRHSF
ncbi:hypothetical protein CQA53_05290 [Helicobacter didelphidarum]|uniref:BspA family leucine-rich repeat surface protein n=1 Tax=Helicobacter didelphidarum TaxID=2040648 RepID=A0A3D8IKJ6_9HELI|nr:BspA family leucine-rich repeat surface protein [Helicobacter didelphidarum]RDU65867.1 hypothetical protein CQA53_05290 [Helicobacter didelphidarum]